jgi:pimeloyl-ACP methyl ester carboxylesterase
MRSSTGLPACLLLLGTFCVVQGCRTAAPDSPGPVGPEPTAIPVTDADLPSGFRAELVDAPVFGGQVFVLEGGRQSGPLVVLVHGLGENGSRDFYPILGRLARSYRVLAVDLPGFGRSTHGTLLYSPERYAELIHALVRRRFAGSFNLVGHSMGGAISLMLASRFPADVERLFLIDAAGFLHRKAYVNFAIAAGLDSVFGIMSGPGKNLLNLTLDAAALAVGPLPTAPEPDFLLANDLLRPRVLQTPTRIAALATMLENFGPRIAEVKAPTWILWGRNDPIASLRTAKILERRLPTAELQVLEKSGHDPMSSEPDSVSRFLLHGLSTAPSSKVRATPAPATAEAGRCEGKNGVRFTGSYSEIEISGCQDVVLDGVRTGSIRVRDSVVTIETSEVFASEVALDVKNSKVEVTASDFAGSVAVETSGSDLDLAGVVLQGRQKSVHVGGSSRLIFSISRLDSPVGRRYIHELVETRSGEEL